MKHTCIPSTAHLESFLCNLKWFMSIYLSWRTCLFVKTQAPEATMMRSWQKGTSSHRQALLSSLPHLTTHTPDFYTQKVTSVKSNRQDVISYGVQPESGLSTDRARFPDAQSSRHKDSSTAHYSTNLSTTICKLCDRWQHFSNCLNGVIRLCYSRCKSATSTSKTMTNCSSETQPWPSNLDCVVHL
jgi:hypothetical protein